MDRARLLSLSLSFCLSSLFLFSSMTSARSLSWASLSFWLLSRPPGHYPIISSLSLLLLDDVRDDENDNDDVNVAR